MGFLTVPKTPRFDRGSPDLLTLPLDLPLHCMSCETLSGLGMQLNCVTMQMRLSCNTHRSFSCDVITFLNRKLKIHQSLYPHQARTRGSIFISVYNFTAQWCASFGNQSILNFQSVDVCDTRVC